MLVSELEKKADKMTSMSRTPNKIDNGISSKEVITPVQV